MDEKKLDGFARTLFKSLTARVPFATALASLPSASSSSLTFGAPPRGDDRSAAVARRACARSSRFNPYGRDAAARKKACRGLGGESQSRVAPPTPGSLRPDDAAWPLAGGAELRPSREDGAPVSLVPSQPPSARCCLSPDWAAPGGGGVFASAAAETGAPTAIASGPLEEDGASKGQHFSSPAATPAAAGVVINAAAELGLVAGDLSLVATATTEPVSVATMAPAQASDVVTSSESGGGLPFQRGSRFSRSLGASAASAVMKFFRNSVRHRKNDLARGAAARAPLRDVKNVQSIDGACTGDSSSPSSSSRCRQPAAAAAAGDRKSAAYCRSASQDVSVCGDFGTGNGTQNYCQPTVLPENRETQTIASPVQAGSGASDARNASFKVECDRDQPRDIASSRRCCSAKSTASPVGSLVPVDEMQPLSGRRCSSCSTQYLENIPPQLATTDESSLRECCEKDCASAAVAVGTSAAVAASPNGLSAGADFDAACVSTCTSIAECEEAVARHTVADSDALSCTPTAASCSSRMFDSAIAEFVKAERSYVQNLRDVIIGYKNHCEKYEGLFSQGDVTLLFGNISDIYRFSCELLSSVEQCVKLFLQSGCDNGGQNGIAGQDTVQVLCRTDDTCQNADLLAIVQSSSSLCCNFARCFLDRVQGFLVYSDYCTNHDRAAQLYASLVCEARYRSFFEGCHLLQGMGKIPLSGFLLTPVQKICKYHLQLSDLVRHSACSQSTVADGTSKGCCQMLSSALARMRDVVHQVNESKRLAESRRAIEEWQVKVAHWRGDDVSRVNSRLVHSGELVLEGWLASERSGVLKRVSRRRHHYFLFDRELVECRKASSLHGGRQLSLCRRYRLARTATCCADAATDGTAAAVAAGPDCPTDADVLWELVDSECAAAGDDAAGNSSTVRLSSVPAKSPHSLLLRPTRRLVNDAKDGGVTLLCMRTAAEKAEWLQAIDSLSRA